MENENNLIILLRKSEYDKMCKIQQDLYKTCVVPDDFDELKDVPLTMAMSLEYQFWRNVEKEFADAIIKLFKRTTPA